MKNGFTLVELLVVLVIISLASAVVFPRITAPMGNLALKTASKKIAASLRFARSRAVTEKITRIGVFDFTNNRFMVFLEENNTPDKGDRLESGKQPEISYDLPKGVLLKNAVAGDDKIDSGLFEVSFLPNGGSSGGEIIVGNSSGKRFGIQVDFITGMVQLSALETEM